MKTPFLLSILLPLALGGCGAFGGSDDCSDGADNDGDGLIDKMDPGCALNGNREAPDPVITACNDGEDNDGDTLIDLDDPGCDNALDEDEFNEPIAACQDGIDNDSDGLIDFPNDPGCPISLKDSEVDDCPNGTGCPACANGIDDDGDGKTDYPDDLGCNSAGDSDEFNSDPSICGGNVLIQPLPSSGDVMGQFTGASGNELISSGCGGLGEEHVYVYEPASPKSLVITTDFSETVVDTVLYVRSDCRNTATELGCNDDDGLGVSTLKLARVEAGTYYIIVDTASTTALGNYHLSVTAYTPEKEACNPASANCAPGLECRIFVDAGGSASSETCEKPECSDGQDSDGDGILDFPEEPGCESATDSDESDSCPSGLSCPQCSNNADDDGDGATDYPNDPGCSSASDNFEVDACIPGVEVIPLTGAGATGTTAGTSHFDPTCDFGSSGPEDIFQFKLDRAVTSLSFSTIGSSYDTVLSVRLDTCGDSSAQLACEDPNSAGETVTFASPALGDYYVFVDGAFEAGDYILGVDAILPAGAACTPGEAGFTCTTGYTCRVDSCVVAACNDGLNNGDGDTLIDFPADPGCASTSDDDESDNCPNGMGCPACANNIDDDGDLLTDYPADPGCLAASDNLELDECIAGVPVTELSDSGDTGVTVAANNHFNPSCDSSTKGEVVYAYRNVRNLASVTFSTIGSPGDTVLSVRLNDCGSSTAELACSDPGSGGEAITISSPIQNATYFVFVDSAFSSTMSYVINVSGTLSAGSVCVQGNSQYTCSPGFLCGTSNTCVATQCNDNSDNDADNLVDFNDPGCSSIDDNNESDDPTPTPQCADGVDNDADMIIDYPADPGCRLAADDSEVDCADTDPVVSIITATTTGTTTGATSDFNPSCVTNSAAPDIVHEIRFPGTLDSLTVDTNGSTYDTILYMKAAECTASDLVCNDDAGTGLQSAFTQASVAAGVYFIFVDGFSSNAGAYTLNISGVISSGAACDMAQISAGILSCATGTTCTAGTCQ